MILVGLGNPGPLYAHARHNLGFMVIDQVAELLFAPAWKEDQGVAWTKIHDHLLIKPQEFMNVSGSSLKNFFAYKKITPVLDQSFLVIHDDLDFPPGTVKVDFDRSSGGHNGVQSIIDTFQSQFFSRLRIGIGSHREKNISATEYVVQAFTSEEWAIIQESIKRAVTTILEKLDKKRTTRSEPGGQE